MTFEVNILCPELKECGCMLQPRELQLLQIVSGRRIGRVAGKATLFPHEYTWYGDRVEKTVDVEYHLRGKASMHDFLKNRKIAGPRVVMCKITIGMRTMSGDLGLRGIPFFWVGMISWIFPCLLKRC